MRQDRPDERRGQGRSRRALDQPGAGRRGGDRPGRAPSRRRCPTFIEPMLATLCPTRVRRPPTGCSRSSGTATGSRRSSATAGPAADPQRQGCRAVLPRAARRRRPGSTPARRSSTARWSRSTDGPGLRRIVRALLQAGGISGDAGGRRRRRSSTRPSTCSTSTAGRSCGVPLEERKRLLRSVLRDQARASASRPTSIGDGPGVLSRRRRPASLEGIIAKQRRSPLRARPALADAWLKIKMRPEQELVVGGYCRARATPKDLGARARRRVRGRHGCATRGGSAAASTGRPGAGSASGSTRSSRTRLAVRSAPAADTGDLRGGARWAEPEIVIRAEFAGWTRDGTVRQARSRACSTRRDPRSVVRERPVDGRRVTGRRRRGVER